MDCGKKVLGLGKANVGKRTTEMKSVEAKPCLQRKATLKRMPGIICQEVEPFVDPQRSCVPLYCKGI